MIGADTDTRPRSPAMWTAAPGRCWSARTWSTSTPTTRAGRSSRPPRHRLGSGPDTRVRWCVDPTPGCVPTFRDPATGQAVGRRPGHRHADVHLARQLGQQRACPGAPAPRSSRPPPARTATTSTRSPTSGTRPGATRRCSPRPSATTPTPPVANLFAMHNRMHDWSYQLGFTESAWNLQAVNLTPAGLGGDAEQGRAQQGALTGNRNNANQGTAARRAAADHQHVPLAAAGRRAVPAVRRRRLRHDGDRPRVHPRDHQPDDRRPGQRDQRPQGGSMGESWGDLLAAEYLFQHGCARPARRPSSPAATSPATWSAASATTT